MLRHVIAPTRRFSQVPNEIIRHPRLSSAAIHLLTWQLSLPEGADESLSKSAERADIGRAAFQRAKAQLLAEGYLFEWREQTGGGKWRTTQMVSNVPLTKQEATARRDGPPAAGAPAPEQAPPPSAPDPAAGEPEGRAPVPQPRKEAEGDTSNPPSAAVGRSPRLEEAAQLLRSVGRMHPRLLMSARKVLSWAPLAVPWLELGVPLKEVRRMLTGGLDDVRSPLGVLRWRLEHALPDPAVRPQLSAVAANGPSAPLRLPPLGPPPETPYRRDLRDPDPATPPPGWGLELFRATRTALRTAQPGSLSLPTAGARA